VTKNAFPIKRLPGGSQRKEHSDRVSWNMWTRFQIWVSFACQIGDFENSVLKPRICHIGNIMPRHFMDRFVKYFVVDIYSPYSGFFGLARWLLYWVGN
jgi:hypothetical protein